MESLPLHPLVVHLPIGLALLMPFVAGGLLLAAVRGWLPGRSWALVCALQAVLALSGWAALRTGETDEERVEHVVPHAALEEHEEAAERFVGASVAVLVLALGSLALRGRRSERWLGGLTTAGTLVVLGLGLRAGHAGGELVYRHGAASAAGAGAPLEREDDDEESESHAEPDGWSARRIDVEAGR